MTESPGGPAIDVRPAKAADAPEIARVHVESWRATYPGLVPQSVLDGLSVERRTDFWSGLLRDPGETRTWVGEVDGRIAGFVGTGLPDDPGVPGAELKSIYVSSTAQGIGLGRLLLETAVRDLVERGFSSAILWVLTANTRARQFYEAAGWRADGTAQMLDFDGTAVEEAPLPGRPRSDSTTLAT